MTGKVCVLTGASSGIGKAACAALAGLGATMIMVVRDLGKGQTALAEVKAAATGEAPRLELADLASASQVKDLARRLGELPRIDVLINNAGLVMRRKELTEDGIEHTFAVNHLAPFLLTNLLLTKLEADSARIVNVASIGHRFGRINLDDIADPKVFIPLLTYGNSKLANILFTRELARRLEGTGATANCLHPGTVRSGFGNSGEAWLRYGFALIGPLVSTPEQGASTVVYLASSPEVEGKTGGYYVKRKLRRPSRAARNDDLAVRLWDFSAKLTGLE